MPSHCTQCGPCRLCTGPHLLQDLRRACAELPQPRGTDVCFLQSETCCQGSARAIGHMIEPSIEHSAPLTCCCFCSSNFFFLSSRSFS